MKKIQIIVILILAITGSSLFGQKAAGPHDFGKMWTFENPPKEWFAEAYDFEPSEAWFNHVQTSAVKFGTWCSGSFVSPKGLIMTNYHCSGSVIGKAEYKGEDFMNNGYYARTLEAERKVPGLFVDQLVKIEKITDKINNLVGNPLIADLKLAKEQLLEEYRQKTEWQDLRLEIVEYYSGSRFSIYGYKRYNDIRLVMTPESTMGLYGGDPDNFTYPRYSLDFTFWRAYDENGQPADTRDHYFKFNINGPSDGEAVFVVGNPARTERYRTVAQLEYDRDYKYPMLLEFYDSRYNMMTKEYEKNPTSELMNKLLYFGNTRKVIKGINEGLHDEILFNRKAEMEKMIRTVVKDTDEWDNIQKDIDELKPHAWAANLLGPSSLKGNTFVLLHTLAKYEKQLAEQASETELQESRNEIRKLVSKIGNEEDRVYLTMTLDEIQKFVPNKNKTMKKIMDGKTSDEFVAYLYKKSKFYQGSKYEDYLEMDGPKLAKKNDPLLKMSRDINTAFNDAILINRSKNQSITDNQLAIAKKTFTVLGDALSPDATFTLRLSDGIVKGYDYNGTQAPFQTTYFGLYDRYFSRTNKGSWDIPQKWQNPTLEFLKTPLNFVSTNDIIGGNSGSPIINKKMEIVGLVFDGNIESLPGNFIFDDEVNRTVSVHAGGIIGALQYIYEANRLSMELLRKN